MELAAGDNGMKEEEKTKLCAGVGKAKLSHSITRKCLFFSRIRVESSSNLFWLVLASFPAGEGGLAEETKPSWGKLLPNSEVEASQFRMWESLSPFPVQTVSPFRLAGQLPRTLSAFVPGPALV